MQPIKLLESIAQHIVDWGLSGLPTRSQSDEMRAAILALHYTTQAGHRRHRRSGEKQVLV